MENLDGFIEKKDDILEIFHCHNEDVVYIKIKENTFLSTNLYKFLLIFNKISKHFYRFHKQRAKILMQNALNEIFNNESIKNHRNGGKKRRKKREK